METLKISLAAARVNAGMTQKDAAEAMHVSTQTIVNWEKGRIEPRIGDSEKLCRLYKIPYDNIFFNGKSTISR